MPASSLADVVDSLLGKGTVLLGETSISLAGVDLVYLQVQLMLSSTANLVHGGRHPAPAIPPLGWSDAARKQRRAVDGSTFLNDDATLAYDAEHGLAHDVIGPQAGGLAFDQIPEQSRATDGSSADDESPEKGLARLALTVVELLRQTVERQAVRRVDAGGLADEEVERMGVALMELENKMGQLREMFGLTEEETNLDLGPIGQVL